MLIVPQEWMLGFLLVMARVGGLMALAPLPGARMFPPTAKAAFVLVLSFLLLPTATILPTGPVGMGTMTAWMLHEAAFGLAVGLALLFLNEMLALAAQMLGFQAGYSYINTIDPSTQVDATILNVLLALLGGLLLFSLDLHLQVIRALAVSLTRVPLGEFTLQAPAALQLAKLGSTVFETAVRLALPVVAILLLLDIALALLSYVNARLQLLTLSFPIKMLVTMGALYIIVLAVPRLFQDLVRQALAAVYRLLAV